MTAAISSPGSSSRSSAIALSRGGGAALSLPGAAVAEKRRGAGS